MTIDGLLERANDVGFDHPEVLRTLARRALALRPKMDIPASVYGTRLGGPPVLAPASVWPRYNGRPLAFIAQLDLDSLPVDAVGIPEGGLLSFFYEQEQSTWGFDPKDAGSFAVVHTPDATEAVAMEWPDDLPEDARYAACSLVAEPTMTLPKVDSVWIESLELDEESLDAYGDLLEAITEEPINRGLLGGHPDQIQSDMPLECAMVAAGLYCGDATSYQESELPAFAAASRDWRLLLQVPTVEDIGMMWGDAGCLYYWIREADLRARRFERSWMILQCG